MRKIALITALLATVSFAGARGVHAQEVAPSKVAILLVNQMNGVNFAYAIARARQMKAAGIEVVVLFDGNSVLPVARARGFANDPAFRKMEDEAYALELATTSANMPAGFMQVRERLFETVDIIKEQDPGLRDEMAAFLASGISYEVSSLAAKNYGLLDFLKSKSEKLTKDDKTPIDVSRYILEGYTLMSYGAGGPALLPPDMDRHSILRRGRPK